MKLLVINPHLSTGGCPQYLYKFLIHNKQNYSQIKVVEFSNFSDEYVVQKNKIKNLIGENNVICLGNFWENDEKFYKDKFKLLKVIKDFTPDIIWFNEFPETFEYKLPPVDLMNIIYDKNRKYKLIETTHNNSFNFNNKIFIPDEFMFCSELHLEKSKNINIKKTVWEVPVENLDRPDRTKTLESLGLESDYLHVLNVGIFNSNKNQKYIFDLAEKLKNYKIKFHFIGNTCFLNDCGISKEQLSLKNCKVWGERSDVDIFMSCMDVFLFPSHNELNPLSVREALSWNMDVICKECSNYTYKYINNKNFYLLNNIDMKKFLINKYNSLSSPVVSEEKKIKFALYTTFYNCARFVDNIFDNVLNLNYDNFTWFITDDFSPDNTKELIFNKLKNLNTNKIKYVEQKFKKEMYWQPNNLIDKSYEYIVLLDADDNFDLNFLNIYNKFLSDDKSIHFLTCDFKKINENNRTLHSLGLLNNNEPLKTKINKFHPSIDYLNSLNYYCFGFLRCFKNIENLQFEIKDFDACAEDSYHTMYINSFGKWLHLPRNLYTWIHRKDSESHAAVKNNFNDNFDIAYQRLINSESLVDTRFNSLYKETCALNYLDINFDQSVSIFTKNSDAEKLYDIFFDKQLSINDYDFSDVYVFVYNDYKDPEINRILNKIKNKNAKIIFYYQFDQKYNSNEEKDFDIDDFRNIFLKNLSEIAAIDYWFAYIRHLYITATLTENTIVINDKNSEIEVFEFDPKSCIIHYKSNIFEDCSYDLEITDCAYNFRILKTKVALGKDIKMWTNFDFAKNIISDYINVKFIKNGNIVFDKRFKVNDNNPYVQNLFKDMKFESDFDCGSYIEVFLIRTYDKYNTTVEKDDIVVDIGANVGAFTKFSLMNGCKKIYCCEPNPYCNNIIKKYYGNDERLVMNEYAISDTIGTNYLKVDVNNKVSGASQLATVKALCKQDNDLVEVKTNTFANFIKENNIQKIDFLKVDCEGGENYIFNEENFEFIKNNVKKMVVEYHNEYRHEIKKILINANFNIVEDAFDPEYHFGLFYANKIKTVNIVNESGSLGDSIAWTPIVNEYAIKNNCKVNFFTPHKQLFQSSYPSINFFNYFQKPEKDVIKLGCFDDKKWRHLSLQEIASDILQLEKKEIRCKINIDKSKKRNFKNKYVCIATQSTLQSKYWNNKDGWINVVNYLKQLGYDVVCIDKHKYFGIPDKQMNEIPYNCIDKTGDLPLEDRINDLVHCEFFIGLGSGLSWLAWACEKPVVMISGFSDPKSEFYTPYRVHNKNVCNSCWNDESLFFDKGNWFWCPRNKNFECSREITFEMVKEKIDLCISDLKNQNNRFDWLKIDDSFENSVKKEIFDDKIYEKINKVSEGDIVVDLGASVGPFTFSVLNKNPKHIYALEPSADMFLTLKKNMQNYKNVTCLNYAIDNDGTDGYENNFNYIFHDKIYESKSITFKTFLNRFDIKKIDFLKVDIEGSEYALFKDECLDILKSNVKFLVAEFHLGNKDLKNKFRNFRDNIINKFKTYEVYSIDGIDIKWDLYNDHFLDYYTEVIIHIQP